MPCLRTASLFALFLTGCYAAREPARPDDAFRAIDGGADALQVDAAPAADAFLPDAFAPDAFAPDAITLPDAWFPELGPDCSLGGTEDAYEFSGSEFISRGSRWRVWSPEWDLVDVDEIEYPDLGTSRQAIFLYGRPPNSWTFMFQSPDGPLQTGEFLNAQRAPFAEPGRAGVWVAGMGNGCNTNEGSLTVHEISVVDGQLRRLRASFTQTCAPSDGTLVGCIRYTAP